MSFKSPYRMIFPGWRAARDAAMGLIGATYADRVLGHGPIAYWPLWEASGTVAECQVNALQNGTYNSDVSTWPVGDGIGDGNTAPGFDGTNDYIDVLTAALQAAFNKDEGTLMYWAKVANVGVWTDGATRACGQLRATASNRVLIYKLNPNQVEWNFRASGANHTQGETRANLGIATDWFCVAITWTQTADEVKCYCNGTQVKATVTPVAAWAGALAIAAIGALDLVLNGLWHGWLAHSAVWDTPLPQPQLADLATV